MPGTEAFVFSRTLDPADCPGVTVSDDPAGTVAALKATPAAGYRSSLLRRRLPSSS
jgi:hypothetical protein